MVVLGGFFQFKVQKNAEKNFSTGKILVHKKLKRSLKVDAVLGIIASETAIYKIQLVKVEIKLQKVPLRSSIMSQYQ